MKKLYIFLFTVFISGVLCAQITQYDGYYFRDGKYFTGIYEQFDESGSLTARIQIRNGLPDGTSEYFENGILVEKRAFKNGLKHGIWEKFEGGKKVSEAVYLKDRKHGKWVIWDTSGVLRYEMYYKKGKKTGTWKMWDENGTLISEKTH